MMACPDKTTLYIGVTSNLYNRVWKHRNKYYTNSFTSKYNCVMLVYYSAFDRIEEAIAEEKRLKGCSRQYKESLINSMNQEWKDLWDSIGV